MSATTITIPRPDDWHLHLRDGAALRAVLAHTAQRFARAIVMPNLKPPIADVDQAAAYRDRILAALEQARAAGELAQDAEFTPLMTLYLTPQTTPETIRAAAASGFIFGVKLYPAGATTNSQSGVASLEAAYPVFEAMEREGVVLQIHGEVTDGDVDIFDREKVFIERHLIPIVERFSGLRVVLEHITTKEAATYVLNGPERLAATITPQHLLMNRNAIFVGGIRPHHYCLPILKREEHRQALVAAAVSDHPRFFIGTDSAPHARDAKENACGCAGIYNAHGGVEFYAEAFDEAIGLGPQNTAGTNRFADFMSRNGPAFYGLAENQSTIALEKRESSIPESYPFVEDQALIPLRAGGKFAWTIIPDPN